MIRVDIEVSISETESPGASIQTLQSVQSDLRWRLEYPNEVRMLQRITEAYNEHVDLPRNSVDRELRSQVEVSLSPQE